MKYRDKLRFSMAGHALRGNLWVSGLQRGRALKSCHSEFHHIIGAAFTIKGILFRKCPLFFTLTRIRYWHFDKKTKPCPPESHIWIHNPAWRKIRDSRYSMSKTICHLQHLIPLRYDRRFPSLLRMFSRSRKPKTFPDVHFVFSSLLPQGHRLEKKR